MNNFEEIRKIQLDLLAREQTIITILQDIRKDFKQLNEKLDLIDKETFICNQCLELKTIDEIGSSELAQTDRICGECMEQGYGK